jgi:hypothetical protein
MKIQLVIFALLTAQLTFGADLISKSGLVYSDYTVTRVEPDGIHIKHSQGIIKLPFEDLPDDILSKYELNSESAIAYRVTKVAEQRKRDEQMRRNLEAEIVNGNVKKLIEQLEN